MMLNRAFCVSVIVSCVATAAMADVLVTYTSAADLDPATANIEIDPGTLPLFFTIDIALTSSAGSDIEGAGAAFGFGDPLGVYPAGLSLVSFEWNPDIYIPPCKFFCPKLLPDPAFVGFAPADAFTIPAGGVLPLAELDVEVSEGVAPGTLLTLPTNAAVFDMFGFSVPLDEGSDPFSIVVVPEPGTVLLFVTALLCTRPHRPVGVRRRLTFPIAARSSHPPAA